MPSSLNNVANCLSYLVDWARPLRRPAGHKLYCSGKRPESSLDSNSVSTSGVKVFSALCLA